MRTVTLQSVYEGVLMRFGLDPIRDAPNQDFAARFTDRATKRIRKALEDWDTPETTRTEERAYRQVWSADKQFLRDGEDGPDEVYNMPDDTYYRVIATAPNDPPVGTIPSTGTDYFEEMETVEPYIERDQPCRHSLGVVLGVYQADPSVNGWMNPNLSFQPSERGIKVFNGTSNYPWWFAPNPPLPASPHTVFVWYQIPPPVYTMKPWIQSRQYSRGDRRFYPPPDGDGNCYRAIQATLGNVPTDPVYWALEPVPYILSNFLEAAAFADMAKMPNSGIDPQAAIILSTAAESEAKMYWEHEIDNLIAQGQKHFYGGRNWQRTNGLWASQPWGGDKVIALSDVCESDQVFPPTPEQPMVREIFMSDIVSFYTTSPNVVEVPTRNLLPGSIIQWVEGPSGNRIRQNAQLLSGPVTNAADPGQRNPDDYDANNNNKHWELIG